MFSKGTQNHFQYFLTAALKNIFQSLLSFQYIHNFFSCCDKREKGEEKNTSIHEHPIIIITSKQKLRFGEKNRVFFNVFHFIRNVVLEAFLGQFSEFFFNES